MILNRMEIMAGNHRGFSSQPVALITGASRGLGREIAVMLGENGYSVVISYLSSDEEAVKVAEKAGPNPLLIRGDAGDMKQAEETAARIEKVFGRLDAVINNAGITRDNLLLRQTEQEWDTVLRTNLKGCFNIIRTAAPLMIKSGGGHIINISSYSGVKGKAGQAAYSASKAALIGLSLAAASELAEHNISANAVLPGYMMSGMGRKAADAAGKAKAASISGRFSDPREVAEFIVWLLKTRNITGQVFSLDSRII